MCTTDGDPAVFFSQERVWKARKPWKCIECDGAIPIGYQYIKTSLMMERGDRPERYETHVGCDAVADFVRTKICEAHGEHGYINLGELQFEVESLDGYLEGFSESEAEFAASIGLDAKTATCRQVAEWVWDFARELEREAFRG